MGWWNGGVMEWWSGGVMRGIGKCNHGGGSPFGLEATGPHDTPATKRFQPGEPAAQNEEHTTESPARQAEEKPDQHKDGAEAGPGQPAPAIDVRSEKLFHKRYLP
jgi:hypothetical protein